MPAAAIAGSAVVGAIASNSAAQSQASAARHAADAQTQAANQANATDLAIYNDQRNLLTPGITAGAEANARRMLMLGYTPAEVRAYLQSTAAAVSAPGPSAQTTTPTSSSSATTRTSGISGIIGRIRGQVLGGESPDNLPTTTPDASSTATPASTGSPAGADYSWVDSYNPQSFLESTPGYQFQYGQGLKALDRGAAARGRLFSGATGAAEQRYGQDYASNYWDRLFNQYGSLAGEGQQNTGTTVNVAGQYGSAVNANTINAGNARASGYIRAGDAAANGAYGIANSIAGGVGAYGQYQNWWG